MTKIAKRILALALATTLTFSLCSCKNASTDSDKDQDKDTTSDASKDDDTDADVETEIDRSETITLDLFSRTANYAGEMTGWYPNWLKEKFNIKLNIIAPNISGDAIYQTRAASGNIGDIVVLGSGDAYDCYESGLLLDITDYYENSKYLKDYELSVNRVKDYFGTDKVFGVNASCSTNPADSPVFENNSIYVGSYMRADYYDELGRPEMKDWQGMLDVLKDMQDAHPVSEKSGGKVYGFSLFPNWDGTYMALAGKFGNMYGYSEGAGFYFTNQDATEYQDIAQDDGVYHKGLEILFTANQMGLVDPESTTQNYGDLQTKTSDEEVLFGFWAFQVNQYNNAENKGEGKMFGYIPVGDQQLITNGHNPYGESYIWSIGSQTKYPERAFEFYDWCASSEYTYSTQQCGAGIEGTTFEMVDGKAVLTEIGEAAKADGEYNLPDDVYGGGSWTDGANYINSGIGYAFANDPATNEGYAVSTWSSYIDKNWTPADELYADILGGHKTCADYLLSEDKVIVIPGTKYTAPIEDTLISTMRSDCGSIIKQYSWQMVFAKDRAEFDALWNTMKTEIEGFGYQEVLDYDLATLTDISAARKEALGK